MPHPWLLALWTLIGATLRFTNLTVKPLWTDEFSTIVFSLGNQFRTIPLNQPIAIATLLQPLQPHSQNNIADVIQHLLTDSNHPPLYFVLTHWWLNLFPAQDGWVSVWAVRSLPALLGVMAIPAIYGLAYLTCRSRSVAHLAALLMALSPFGIYLAQEARHYTLPILWMMASLACLVIAVRAIGDRHPLPAWICAVWILVNALGIATHYFFMLTLVAEGLVLLGIGIGQLRMGKGSVIRRSEWRRIGIVALATLISGLVWLPVVHQIQDSALTQWLYRGGDRTGWALLEPIAQLVAGWITMLYLLPIQAADPRVITGSAMALVIVTLVTIPLLYWGLQAQSTNPETRRSLGIIGGFVLAAIALLLSLTYLFGMDLTSAFRYNFIYFPAALLLVAAGLCAPARLPSCTLFLLLISLLGSLTVITNLGYQKTHRPDLVAQAIQSQSRHPALVAIAHHTHGQTGRLMGIAWELAHSPMPSPHFLLAHQGQDDREPIRALRRSLRSLPPPLDLWLINTQTFPDPPLQRLLHQQHCNPEGDRAAVDGYDYQRYVCEGG